MGNLSSAIPHHCLSPAHRPDPPAWERAGVGAMLTLPMLALLPARLLLACLLPPAQAGSSLPCAPSLPEKCHRSPGNARQAWHQVTAQRPCSLAP